MIDASLVLGELAYMRNLLEIPSYDTGSLRDIGGFIIEGERKRQK